MLNALALETYEDPSVTVENGDCPVENSGSSIDTDSTVDNSTEATVEGCKPALKCQRREMSCGAPLLYYVQIAPNLTSAHSLIQGVVLMQSAEKQPQC